MIDFQETLQTGVGASVSCPGFAKFGFLLKGAGVFERPGQTMDQLCIFGTSRTSNGLKSGP